MTPLSFQEFEALQENFAQANIEAGLKSHYLDRVEAAREAVERGRNLDLIGGEVSLLTFWLPHWDHFQS